MARESFADRPALVLALSTPLQRVIHRAAYSDDPEPRWAKHANLRLAFRPRQATLETRARAQRI